jgi:hypothetical protein
VQAVYHRERNGVEPVDDLIDALAPERQEELDFKIGLLNRLTSADPLLPFPHSSQVEGQLREPAMSLRSRSLPDLLSAVRELVRPAACDREADRNAPPG